MSCCLKQGIEESQNEEGDRDFPGGPAVKTPCFHCRGSGFDSLVGELRSCMPRGTAKKLKK